ncbi:TetR/AcrR family transcriptional regulator [Piscinibacter sp. HJYY11]|uniref:TetR/AcrR family transcriptional regulator n=1 Tax=Piscinibacter sp. HJYY11 TaxID=2801333 RepID=UPI001F2450B2|nr:TetR/AcrR family transcriptional regulator [Piscinibacter sp. HJYY11]
MAPEERREQLLDSAVAYVLDRGLSDFSLEKVAALAGVSVPLIYKYFPKREDILKAVLEREYQYLGARKLAALPADAPLEPLIRNSQKHGFEYLYERGPIIRLLASDRAVSDLVRRRGKDERAAITEHFIDRIVETYGVPRQVAQVCSILVVNAPILSGRALKRVGVTAEEAADLWTDFALGGWLALQKRFQQQEKKPAARKKRSAGPRGD